MSGRPSLQVLDGGKSISRPQADAPVWHPSQGRRRRVVLYISGDVDHRSLFTRSAWRWAKVKLLVAKGGGAGSQMAIDWKPRMVVIDARLPDLEAQALVASLRRRTMAPDTPIVVLAHDGTPKERAQFIWAGATAYVSDIFDPVQIDRTVGMLLEISAWR